MTARLGVRARLTIFVTVVFAGALLLGSQFLLDQVEDALIGETRASAQSTLMGYVDGLDAGAPATAALGPADAATFFYRDADGNELTEHEYLERVLSTGSGADGPTLTRSPDGEVMPTLERVDSAGVPRIVARGENVLAVSQQVEFADGTLLEIGVSSPLQPVAASVATLRDTLWYVIPLLVAAVAGITWLAAQRALRPVHSIIGRTRAITATNLSERVPVPEARDDIRELATTMNDMLGRLERSQDQQRQFIADASHELRSPVAASRAQLEVALGAGSSDWEKTAGTVLAEQETLTRLIDDLLALGRLDEQGIGQRSEVDLTALVAADARRPHSHDVELGMADMVTVMGNERLLTRALRNLVDNADRYATNRVRLEVIRQGDRVLVNVDDDGPGVPVDDRERIFDRFARVDESRQRSEGGAGLGLAIANEVVAAHDGELTCTDSPLGGARFTISIPARGT